MAGSEFDTHQTELYNSQSDTSSDGDESDNTSNPGHSEQQETQITNPFALLSGD